MRWARFEADGKASYGIIENDEIEAVSGDPFDGYERTGVRTSLASVRLLCPVMPRTLYAAGLNYAAHVTALANSKGETPKLPPAADIGYRGSNALIAHNDQIVIPADAGERIQYEAELVVVIGRKAKGLTEADALSCVLGYTIGNDISERDWQASDRTLWRAKSCDTFMPMGPWIETDVDLDAAVTTVRVNGRETLSFPTNSMIFGVAAYISRMSKYMTLYPGDVIWMGTEGTSENLKAGDVVEVDISGIGTLSNPLVRASA
ncbi:fumarylacetoacetate hydrolase family protein [Paraburkholderia sp. ZP32-5]|uniref:fumarylacetoacetate hydrolase family protein n=1 Tax=Paraburkholderia sp. ZP32-5 TaxID=2883245 RepID=UPI001F29E373|nr:fumarylacetoacetate hydrolase family protein [Paraburkholderia sp. ZP32-5]